MTCYRVSQASAAVLGDNTAYVQQQTKLRLLGRRPDPREHVLSALTAFINTQTAVGEDVVVAMDANEALGPYKGRLRPFLTDTGLVDVVGHRHADPPAPASAARPGLTLSLYPQHSSPRLRRPATS